MIFWEPCGGQIVLPDAIGRIEASGRQLNFFLELDQGTESPSRLARKLIGYEEASSLSECPELLLFCLPDHAREASARKALHNCGITIATTTFDRHCAEPLGPNWLALGGERRSQLLDLPGDWLHGDRSVGSVAL